MLVPAGPRVETYPVNAETWATWAGAVVALSAAFVATLQARKANRYAGRSVEAATRSADAGERAASAAEHANDIAEQANAYRPRWNIAPLSDSSFVLTNESGETAHDTVVEPATPGTLRDWSPCDIEDGEQRRLVVF